MKNIQVIRLNCSTIAKIPCKIIVLQVRRCICELYRKWRLGKQLLVCTKDQKSDFYYSCNLDR